MTPPSPTTSASLRPALALPLTLAAVLLVAFNLRPVAASLPPLLETIRLDLGLDHTAIGLLAAIPLLCMGIMPVLGNAIAARFGNERSLLAAMLLVAIALAARVAADNIVLLYASAFAGGTGAAIAQTLMPPSVKRAFGARASSVMGFAAVTMTFGAGIPSGVTAYLAGYLGSWQLALAAWSLPALLATLLWAPVARQAGGASELTAGIGLPLRDALAWRITMVAVATFGLFWSLLSWLPPIYRELGWSEGAAGLLAAANLAAQMPMALLISSFAGRFRDRRPAIAGGIAVTVAGIIGLALWPAATDWTPWLWTLMTGAGIGTIFPITLMLPVDYGRDPAAVRRLAAMSLSVGYFLAGLGPLAFGWLRATTGGYLLPLLLLALTGVATLWSLRGLRPRTEQPT